MKLAVFLLTVALWTCCVTLDEKSGRRFGDPNIVNNKQQMLKETSEGGNVTSGGRAEISYGNGYNSTSGNSFGKPGKSGESSSQKSGDSSDSSYDTSSNENSGDSSESTSNEHRTDNWVVDLGYFSINLTHICMTDDIFNAICRGGDECVARRGILHWDLKLHKCKWWK